VVCVTTTEAANEPMEKIDIASIGTRIFIGNIFLIELLLERLGFFSVSIS
jgi:hypothetical protein